MKKNIIYFIGLALSFAAMSSIVACNLGVENDWLEDNFIKKRMESSIKQKKYVIPDDTYPVDDASAVNGLLAESSMSGEDSDYESVEEGSENDLEANLEKSAMQEKNTPQAPKKVAKSSSAPRRFVRTSSLRKYLAQGELNKIFQAKKDPNNPWHLYYSGIAHYIAALQLKSTTAAHKKQVRLAEEQLRTSGVKATHPEMKAKAILWHGITLYRFKRNALSLDELLKPYQWIEKNLKKTPVYNDSLLYAALAAMEKKDRDLAVDYLNRLSKTYPGDKVYDEFYKKWVSPQAAAKHYLSMIHLGEKATSMVEKEGMKSVQTRERKADESLKPSDSRVMNEEVGSFAERLQKADEQVQSMESPDNSDEKDEDANTDVIQEDEASYIESDGEVSASEAVTNSIESETDIPGDEVVEPAVENTNASGSENQSTTNESNTSSESSTQDNVDDIVEFNKKDEGAQKYKDYNTLEEDAADFDDSLFSIEGLEAYL